MLESDVSDPLVLVICSVCSLGWEGVKSVYGRPLTKLLFVAFAVLRMESTEL